MRQQAAEVNQDIAAVVTTAASTVATAAEADQKTVKKVENVAVS